MRCLVCGEQPFTARAVAIVVGGGELLEPLNLSPNTELRICPTGKCDAAFILASKSVHGFLGRPARWGWARLVFADGHGMGLRLRDGKPTAQA